MPMWCSSSDTSQLPRNVTQAHHRIVRIPPGESVVLNSAERAPYLLLIEILNDDLDFDPAKRSNKDVLLKIVTKENERTGASRDLISFTNSTTPHVNRTHSEQVISAEALLGEDSAEGGDTSAAVIPTSPSSFEEEEIDLVEQLYGTDHSFRSQTIDLTESIVLPPAPKNKELDMVAWSRSSSILPSADHGASTPLPSSFLPPSSIHSRTSLQPRESVTDGGSQFLSLDEYSERMRTAAIMLSQLNANLVREPVTSVSLPGMSANHTEPEAAPGSSWLPGSGWLRSSSETLHPPPAGGTHDNSGSQPSSTPLRMKLQYSEAAAIRDRIMKEMLALEDERMERMREHREGDGMMRISDSGYGIRTAEDDGIIRRELNKVDPSAVVFSESWAAKKVTILTDMLPVSTTNGWHLLQSRIRHGSPYGHLGLNPSTTCTCFSLTCL
jgi:hypothetical protein